MRNKARDRVLWDALRGKWFPVLCYYLAIVVFFLLNVSLLALNKITEPEKHFFVSTGVIIFINLKT